jgi:hypothetical protein
MMLSQFTFAQEEDEFDREINNLKQQYAVPNLTKKQMYEDFDTLVSIMEKCNPQYLVRKSASGYDMIAVMKSYRHSIDTINNMTDFILLLSKILNFTQDKHCTHGRDLWWYQYSFYEKDVQLNRITDNEFGINFHYQDILYKKYPPSIDVFFTDNKYYLKYPTILFNETDSIIVETGTEILLLNGQSPLYLDTLIARRWDLKHHVFYNEILFLHHDRNTIQLLSNGEVINYQFTSFLEQESDFGSPKPKINYMTKDSLLYIRLPFMVYNANIQKELQQKLLSYKNKPIQSVLIDVRGNPGGSDELWIYLLGMIINKTITFDWTLITNTDNDVYRRLGIKKAKNIQYDCLHSDYHFSIYQKGKYPIKKQKESLNYPGTIYLLADEDIYSSTCGLSSLNKKTNAIKVIGMPTGILQGQGVNSVGFMLPHSKFAFLLDVVLDATNVKNAEDFYFGYIDYPLSPNIDYYKYWYGQERSNHINEEEMYQKDEAFSKALEIIKQTQRQKE